MLDYEKTLQKILSISRKHNTVAFSNYKDDLGADLNVEHLKILADKGLIATKKYIGAMPGETDLKITVLPASYTYFQEKFISAVHYYIPIFISALSLLVSVCSLVISIIQLI